MLSGPRFGGIGRRNGTETALAVGRGTSMKRYKAAFTLFCLLAGQDKRIFCMILIMNVWTLNTWVVLSIQRISPTIHMDIRQLPVHQIFDMISVLVYRDLQL
jgi:hypothetical protein